MDSGLTGDSAVLPMKCPRCENVDEVRQLAGEHLAEVAVHPRTGSELVAALPGARNRAVTERNDVDLRDPCPAAQMIFGDHAAAVNDAAKPVHGRFRMCSTQSCPAGRSTVLPLSIRATAPVRGSKRSASQPAPGTGSSTRPPAAL